jgi:hypothetical protein
MTTSGQALLRQLALLRCAKDIRPFQDVAMVKSLCDNLRALVESDTAGELLQQHNLMKQVASALAQSITVLWENLGHVSTCAGVQCSLQMLLGVAATVTERAHDVAVGRDEHLLLLARQLAESGMPAKLQALAQLNVLWLVVYSMTLCGWKQLQQWQQQQQPCTPHNKTCRLIRAWQAVALACMHLL